MNGFCNDIKMSTHCYKAFTDPRNINIKLKLTDCKKYELKSYFSLKVKRDFKSIDFRTIIESLKIALLNWEDVYYTS